MNCLLLPSSRFLLNDDCFCNLLLLLAKNMLLLVLLSGGMVWNCCHPCSRGWGCRNGRCKLKSCMAWNRVRLTRMVMRCLVLLQLSLISVTTLANSANKWLLTYKILWYVVKNTMKCYKCKLSSYKFNAIELPVWIRTCVMYLSRRRNPFPHVSHLKN